MLMTIDHADFPDPNQGVLPREGALVLEIVLTRALHLAALADSPGKVHLSKRKRLFG